MPLPTLHHQMRQCRLCAEAGHEILPGAVFSAGSNPRVLLIGQAPGVTEAVSKRPFNASSGQRLFTWLAEAGWEEGAFRGTHYMTAVTKCYPGKHPNGKGDRVPSPAEQALCRPYLEQEIRLINPRLMILVGKLAIQLLYPAKATLQELIGTAAYFPPSALTADPLNFDLGRAKQVTQFGGEPDGRYVVPLPHPSGASLWPNLPANKALIGRALALLAAIREGWELG
ncbi:MAG: uracil-DNA glycosylase [Chloroflexi bacterium]|nr:uracil-DNA glycosylase [Chloroflexota bacterium]